MRGVRDSKAYVAAVVFLSVSRSAYTSVVNNKMYPFVAFSVVGSVVVDLGAEDLCWLCKRA